VRKEPTPAPGEAQAPTPLEHFDDLENSAAELALIDCYDDDEGRLRCPCCSGEQQHDEDCSLDAARRVIERRDLTERIRAILSAAEPAAAAGPEGGAETGQANV
jgi:hypothetical protein